MNKHKCINKQKLSKKNKNKNKHKHKTNKFLYKIHGGSNTRAIGINANITAQTTQNNSIQQTLRDLIEDKTNKRVIINFNGLKIKCIIGDKKLSFKNYDKVDCITITYEFFYNMSLLNNFFNNNSKLDCIGDDKTINNTKYKGTYKLKESSYNKDLNKLLLKLIDIININLKIESCHLVDYSNIMCNKIKIMLNIKHYERGYGFYNEFGYVYTNNAFNANTLEENITYANTLLQKIHDESHTKISEFKNKIDDIKVTNAKVHELINTLFEQVLKLYIKFKIITDKDENKDENKDKTLREILHEILLFICDSKNIDIIKALTKDETEYINLFIDAICKWHNIDNKSHFKCYKYPDSIINTDSIIKTSELIKSNDDTIAPAFVMTPFIQPTITITRGNGDYIINIV